MSDTNNYKRKADSVKENSPKKLQLESKMESSGIDGDLSPSLLASLNVMLTKNNEILLNNQNQLFSNFQSQFDIWATKINSDLAGVKASAAENTSNIATEKERINELESKLNTAQAKNTDLELRLTSLELKSDRSERANRTNDIIISNLLIQDQASVNYMKIILAIGQVLSVNLLPVDIPFWKVLNNDHREANFKESENVPKPPQGWIYTDLLVKFDSPALKSSFMKAYFTKKNLMNSDVGLSPLRARIYINDNVTIFNYKIFKRAKSVFKIKNNDPSKKLVKSVYIFKGLVYVKTLDDSSHQMKTLADVDSLNDSTLAGNKQHI